MQNWILHLLNIIIVVVVFFSVVLLIYISRRKSYPIRTYSKWNAHNIVQFREEEKAVNVPLLAFRMWFC